MYTHRDGKWDVFYKLHVHVSALGDKRHTPNDMDLFLVLNKLDHGGKRVPFNGSVGNQKDTLSRAYQRASLRLLDAEKSTDAIPYLAFDEMKLLSEGEIVTLDIPFPPTSVWFDAGEALELTIASHEVYRAPPYFKRAANVPGTHRIHFGGQYDSYLQVPIVPVS